MLKSAGVNTLKMVGKESISIVSGLIETAFAPLLSGVIIRFPPKTKVSVLTTATGRDIDTGESYTSAEIVREEDVLEVRIPHGGEALVKAVMQGRKETFKVRDWRQRVGHAGDAYVDMKSKSIHLSHPGEIVDTPLEGVTVELKATR